LKILSFLINSNIFIALAAVSLAFATGAQLGLPPRFHAYLIVIFLATLFDYNVHKFIAVYIKPGAIHIEKLRWAAEHLNLIKILVISAAAGLVLCLFFVSYKILYILTPLAMLSFLYSVPFHGKQWKFSLLGIPGMKTLLLALVWTSATVLLPVFLTDIVSDQTSVWLIFAERFTLIFAIAIPFDIRDIKADAQAGIRTLPITFGTRHALLISNFVMAISLAFASFHYLAENRTFIILPFSVSIGLALFFINNRKMRSLPFYYHGILDGTIFLHGILISLGFYF